MRVLCIQTQGCYAFVKWFQQGKNPLQSINVKADKHISSLNLDHRAMPLPLINLFERYILYTNHTRLI